jgi:AcrR family transcriptional regulator
MPYDYQQTHENILKSARIQFLEKGFREASVRTICKNAGVTNGAFYSHFESKEDLFGSIVRPCIEGLKDLYSSEEDRFYKINSSEDIITAFRKTYASTESLIRYMCDRREDFRILLEAGAGTEYEGFPNELIRSETDSMFKFLQLSRQYVKRPDNITENIIRMGASFLILSVINGLLSGMSAEDIFRETALVSDYCIAGYRELLGI